jgi:hypothetical protein
MICKQQISYDDFKNHFISCRNKLLASKQPKIAVDQTTVSKGKGCGCSAKN